MTSADDDHEELEALERRLNRLVDEMQAMLDRGDADRTHVESVRLAVDGHGEVRAPMGTAQAEFGRIANGIFDVLAKTRAIDPDRAAAFAKHVNERLTVRGL